MESVTQPENQVLIQAPFPTSLETHGLMSWNPQFPHRASPLLG